MRKVLLSPQGLGAGSWDCSPAMGQIGALGRQLEEGVPNCNLQSGNEALKSAARGERKAASWEEQIVQSFTLRQGTIH